MSLFPSSALTLTDSLLGQTLAAGGGGRWRHPWFISPFWVPTAEKWMATVKPGFVSGRAPFVRTTAAEQDGNNRDFGINPLSGQPYFSAHVFGPGTSKATTPIFVDVPLYLSPAMNLTWRAVGYDGDPQFPVPQFFLDRGVGNAPRVNVEEGTISGDTERPVGLRLLRACDFILHQPRNALSSQISLEPGPATGISNVTQTITLRSPAASDALRVYAGYASTQGPTLDAVTGEYDEPAWDELLIGTVFALSPTGVPMGAEPDGTWATFVRHQLFWNLNYQPARFRPITTNAGVPFIPPLVFGVASLAINFIAAGLNDGTQQALNILMAHSQAGYWWTPNGGGHDAVFITSETPVTGIPGLDKAGRLGAQAAAAEAAKRKQRLEPPYPFSGVPIDPAIFVV
jgi:hypothetical protein